MRVLLVEDNELFGDALRDHLAARGWSVVWAKDLDAGVRSLESDAFDLLCLDRRLPDGDGFDVLRRDLARCPTIVLSAFDQMSDRLEARGLGAADYLVKPFDLREAVSRIDMLCRAAVPSKVQRKAS